MRKFVRLSNFFHNFKILQGKKLSYLVFTLFWGIIAAVTLPFTQVLAANVNFPTSATVSLTSPAVNFSVLENSSADSFVVNATSVVITVTAGVSSSTLTSALRDFNASSTATITKSCSGGGTATIIVSGTGTATLTPAASQCVGAASGGGSASYVYGYGGGGGGPTIVASTTIATTPVSTSTLKATASTSTVPNLNAQTPQQSPPKSSFKRNLYIGSTGEDVRALQLFLISKGAGSAMKRLAKVGASGRFLGLTQQALIEYQKSVGLPATGYFGVKTRRYILEHGSQP